MSTTDTQNGRAKGRIAPAVPIHTFQDSGITVRLHKLSPMTGQDLVWQVQKELADSKPKPPIYEVDYGKGKIEEPNVSHPVYVARLAEWDAEVNKRANDRLFRTAALIAVEIIGDEKWREEVRRHKRIAKATAKLDWYDDPDLEPAENDQIYYIKHIACRTKEDTQEFFQAISHRSQPTEAAVEAHKASFPGDVQE